jgi:C-terminal processing protease CtpA/Prc
MPKFPVAGSIIPFGSPFPKFIPPPGFQLRLGAAQTDQFLSGTFLAGGSRIGFIRIATLNPADEVAAQQQFQGEIAYFQQNTAALVIDLMGNGGGAICYTNVLLQYLFPSGFPSVGLAPQATQYWVDYLTQYREYWRSIGQLQLVTVYTALIQQTQAALKTHSLGPSMNVCTGSLGYPPARDASGNSLAFTRPILLLTDNFTMSATEFFAATLQDNGRAFVYGTRTNGGGASRLGFIGMATPYSEGATTAAVALAIRVKTIHAPGLPPAPLIENIGVLPDVIADFQTKDNLLTGGATFMQGFVATITKLITTGHP